MCLDDLNYNELLLVATYVRLSEQLEDLQEAQSIFYSPEIEHTCDFYLGIINFCMSVPAYQFKAVFRATILPYIKSLIPEPGFMDSYESKLIHCLAVTASNCDTRHYVDDILALLSERKERSL